MVKAKLAIGCVLLVVFLTSCSKPELPYFLHLENLQFQKSSKEMVELSALAVYHNPNPIKGIITRSAFEIYLDDQLLAEMEQKLSVNVAASSDFSIPISLKFDPSELLKKEGNILLNAAKRLLNQELELRYKGKLYLSFLGKEVAIPVDYREKLELGEYINTLN